jgi:hypothetical protein
MSKKLTVDGYNKFSHFVKRKARHIMDAESQEFISAVIDTSKTRSCLIPGGALLWRAQKGYKMRTEPVFDDNAGLIDECETEGPHEPERMVPWTDKATEGRVNPKGIPCLYLSSDRDTAMSEMRPWVGSYVSVSQFEILRDLMVVDCTLDVGVVKLDDPNVRREAFAWTLINRAFSTPVTPCDTVADYAPTQVLAEAFRSAGYDGIAYGSNVGKGKTIAVFDPTLAKLMNGFLFQVEDIKFEFSESARPYFMKRDDTAKSA